jgi:hypothetical protein
MSKHDPLDALIAHYEHVAALFERAEESKVMTTLVLDTLNEILGRAEEVLDPVFRRQPRLRTHLSAVLSTMLFAQVNTMLDTLETMVDLFQTVTEVDDENAEGCTPGSTRSNGYCDRCRTKEIEMYGNVVAGAKHIAAVKAAGCGHPAFYLFDRPRDVQPDMPFEPERQ